MLNKPLSRRGALSFLGGTIAGVAIDSALNLVDKPTIPLTRPSGTPESCLDGEVRTKFESHINKYFLDQGRRVDHAITKKRALEESSPGSGITKLDFTRQTVFASTVLPEYLKNLICYIPFEESKYRTTAKSPSNPPALGTWQFLPGTAANSQMVGPHIMVDSNGDRRTDYELSTKAAVKYFEYIYKILSADKNYLLLKSRYGLDDNGFLSLTVLHAYNAGEGHMLRAFEVMATEPEVRNAIDLCGKSGDLGLYLYLTEEYSRDPKKWQTAKPYFYKESSAYAYKVIAFQKMDKPLQASDTPRSTIAKNEDETPKSNPVNKISTGARSAVGAMGTLLGWGGSKHVLEKVTGEKTRLDRRSFVTGLGLIAGGAFGSAVSNKYNQYQASRDLRNKMGNVLPGSVPADLPAGDYPEKPATETTTLAPLNAKEIASNQRALQRVYAHTQSPAFISNHQNQQITVKNIGQLPTSQKYLDNLHMAEAAYELYRTQSQETYLQFAKYFYERSLYLTNQQLAGKITAPAKNRAEAKKILDSRKNYLQSALRIINSEFADNNDQ
jgi:hypothetical protein